MAVTNENISALSMYRFACTMAETRRVADHTLYQLPPTMQTAIVIDKSGCHSTNKDLVRQECAFSACSFEIWNSTPAASINLHHIETPKSHLFRNAYNISPVTEIRCFSSN